MGGTHFRDNFFGEAVLYHYHAEAVAPIRLE